MAQFNHIIIPAKDKDASASFLAGILGVEAGKQWGPFRPVQTSNGVTLDFVDSKDVRTQHYAFLVTDEEFDASFGKIKKAGLNGATRDELFRAAHDIKGEAETFGFPHAGRVADSLCRLIEHSPDFARAPFALVEQHVDAVRAIIREAKLKDAEKTAVELVKRLRQVTDDFLAHENRHRPDYLDGILAPPTAPEE